MTIGRGKHPQRTGPTLGAYVAIFALVACVGTVCFLRGSGFSSREWKNADPARPGSARCAMVRSLAGVLRTGVPEHEIVDLLGEPDGVMQPSSRIGSTLGKTLVYELGECGLDVDPDRMELTFDRCGRLIGYKVLDR